MRFVLAIAVLICAIGTASARDDGRYANSPYKKWYEAQRNGYGGICCTEADAHAFYGDYTLTTAGGVEFDEGGQHYELPPDMVLRGPNPTGHAVWWHLGDRSYCFAPGSGG